jgi:hypothetical protein
VLHVAQVCTAQHPVYAARMGQLQPIPCSELQHNTTTTHCASLSCRRPPTTSTLWRATSSQDLHTPDTKGAEIPSPTLVNRTMKHKHHVKPANVVQGAECASAAAPDSLHATGDTSDHRMGLSLPSSTPGRCMEGWHTSCMDSSRRTGRCQCPTARAWRSAASAS